MQEMPKPARGLNRSDLLMLLLCSITSYWLLASPLVPYVFDDSASGITQFLIADILLTGVLAGIGVKLNHLAARKVRITLGRGRRR